jgi:molybdopterin converting factor small subunit
LDIKVRLHATLRRPTPDGYQNRLTVNLDEDATVGSLLEAIGLDQDQDHLMVLIGRRRVDPDHRLVPDEQVDLFPPISGGLGKSSREQCAELRRAIRQLITTRTIASRLESCPAARKERSDG